MSTNTFQGNDMEGYAVVESGSTKTDWAFVLDGQSYIYSSTGINAATGAGISDPLSREIIDHLPRVKRLYFYGAGSNTVEAEKTLRQYFKRLNISQCEVNIYSDLLGAARGCAGHNPGLICILGTGSHSCIYDGKTITDQLPSLGFILSDEGSGNHIGKEIIKAFFYGNMSENDHQLFLKTYEINREIVLTKLYKESRTAAYLASFAPFLHFCSLEFKQRILHIVFNLFIDQRIKNYANYRNFDIYFVGSIASAFEKELKLELESQDLQIKQVLKTPLQNLIAFHNEQ